MAMVLVVDDEPAVRRAICDALERTTHRSHGVPDGAGAIAAARAQHFDAAVVDLKLDGEDGLTVVRDLRAIQPHLAIVVVTGYADFAIPIVAFVQAQPFEFLPKPFTDAALVGAIGAARAQRGHRLEAIGATPVAAERLAHMVVAFLTSQHDAHSISAFCRISPVGVGESTFGRWCKATNVSPHDVLSFARLLRAVQLAGQHATGVIDWMDVDPRTFHDLVHQAGVGDLLAIGWPTLEALMDAQQLISNTLFLGCLRRSVEASREQRDR